MSKLERLVILGPPLSGKGTQGKYIAKRFCLKGVSIGDIFRLEISNKTQLGDKITKIINKGLLVNDDIVNAVVFNYLSKNKIDQYVLDGYPRTMGQALYLSSYEKNTLPLDIVVVINIDFNESIKRSKGRGREDDRSIEIIRKRWKEYNLKTIPVISYYKDRNLIIEINGMQKIEKIKNDILVQLNKLNFI